MLYLVCDTKVPEHNKTSDSSTVNAVVATKDPTSKSEIKYLAVFNLCVTSYVPNLHKKKRRNEVAQK